MLLLFTFFAIEVPFHAFHRRVLVVAEFDAHSFQFRPFYQLCLKIKYIQSQQYYAIDFGFVNDLVEKGDFLDQKFELSNTYIAC